MYREKTRDREKTRLQVFFAFLMGAVAVGTFAIPIGAGEIVFPLSVTALIVTLL